MKRKREPNGLFSKQLLFLCVMSLTMLLSVGSTSSINRLQESGNILEPNEMLELTMKPRSSELNEIVGRLSKLESNFIAVNNRDEVQQQETIFLKSVVVNQQNEKETKRNGESEVFAINQIKREKREMLHSVPTCSTKVCAFDTHSTKNIQPERFYGPPTSCSELQTLGYTLNDYYLIKKMDESNNSANQVVYCSFHQTQAKIQKLETTIGFTGVKTSPVHFYVYLRGHYGKKGPIKFENEFVNIGKGFDWKNQWFVAPYPGIYFISVSGTKDNINKERVGLLALLNGKEIVEALSSTDQSYGPFSFQLSRKLKANDKIELVLKQGIIMFFHFIGWMVEQQFDF